MIDDRRKNIASDYLWSVLEPVTANTVLTAFIDYIKRSGVEFDTVVCRGVSGLLVAPTVARELGKQLIVSRKDGDSSHSSDTLEGFKNPCRYIIVDDLLASGATVKAVVMKMSYYHQKAECAGLFLYRSAHEAQEFYQFQIPQLEYRIPQFNQQVRQLFCEVTGQAKGVIIKHFPAFVNRTKLLK